MILPFPIFVNPDRTNPPAEWKDGTMRVKKVPPIAVIPNRSADWCGDLPDRQLKIREIATAVCAAPGAHIRKIPLDIFRRDWYHGDNCMEKAMTKTDLSF